MSAETVKMSFFPKSGLREADQRRCVQPLIFHEEESECWTKNEKNERIPASLCFFARESYTMPSALQNSSALERKTGAAGIICVMLSTGMFMSLENN